MTQTTKPKVLQSGKGVQCLTTRQIKAICLKHGWTCQMEKVPANEIQVDRRIVCDPRYRKSNAIMVARSAGGRVWLRLGWRWDIETLNEGQIVELLKTLEQSHKSESTSFNGTTGTQA